MGNPYQYTGKGEGFLTDYSNLAAAGSAFNSFADAYTKAKHQQAQDQEMEARTSALKDQQVRAAQEMALKYKMQGLNADGTSAPLTDRERLEQDIKASGAGMKPGYDVGGKYQGLNADPASMKYQQMKANAALAGQRMDLQGQRLGLQQNRFEETQSQNASKAGEHIESDQQMQRMTTAKNSLANGRNLLNGTQPLTYNNLNAVQQDIIDAITKGSQSSEGKVNREMQESWAGRWNNLKAKAGHYGADNDIRKQDPGLFNQIKGLMDEVDSSLSQNMKRRVDTLSSSYGQSSNKKLKKTVEDKVKLYTPESGLVQPGLTQGLTGSAPAPAPGSAPPVDVNNMTREQLKALIRGNP